MLPVIFMRSFSWPLFQGLCFFSAAGFVAPFIFPDYKFDFRLEHVGLACSPLFQCAVHLYQHGSGCFGEDYMQEEVISVCRWPRSMHLGTSMVRLL